MVPILNASRYRISLVVGAVFLMSISTKPTAAADLKENESCYVDDTPGTCQTFRNCAILEQAHRDGTFQTNDAIHCGYTIKEELICCPREWKAQRISNVDLTGGKTTANQRASVKACNRIQEMLAAPFLGDHIYGGEEADPGEFPHAALILYNEDNVICGGSLIDTKFVLTAAHCVISQRRRAIAVRLGIIDMKDTREGLTIAVRDVHIHPSYNGSAKYNDIAIVELAEPAFSWSNVTWDRIGPSCLYTERDGIAVGSNLTVIGWGEVNPKNRTRATNLMKVQLQLYDPKQCDADYRKNNYDTLSLGIIDTQLCAHAKDKDACRGDSGGPLNLIVDLDSKIYKIVGIVSTGPLCGIDSPGLYTRVSAFLDYIEKIVWPQGFNPQ